MSTKSTHIYDFNVPCFIYLDFHGTVCYRSSENLRNLYPATIHRHYINRSVVKTIYFDGLEMQINQIRPKQKQIHFRQEYYFEQ